MPDRDYYLDPSPRMAEIRTKYEAHIAKMLTLAGIADADAKAARIFELEKQIAASAREPRGLGRRRQGQQPLVAARTFPTRAPGLDWPKYFEAAGLGQPGRVRRLAAARGHRPRGARRERAARDVEGVPGVPRARAGGHVPAEGVRRRAVRVLRHGAHRHAEAARPLEARRRPSRTPRSARPSASSTSRAISRRPRRRAPRRWSKNEIAAFATPHRPPRAGWRPRPRRRRRRSSRP